jgi:hypothetical protein
MGKGARECRTETERSRHAEKEDDVSRRSQKDCRSPTSEMGEGEGCGKEVGLKRDHPLWMLPSAGRRTNVWRRWRDSLRRIAPIFLPRKCTAFVLPTSDFAGLRRF